MEWWYGSFARHHPPRRTVATAGRRCRARTPRLVPDPDAASQPAGGRSRSTDHRRAGDGHVAAGFGHFRVADQRRALNSNCRAVGVDDAVGLRRQAPPDQALGDRQGERHSRLCSDSVGGTAAARGADLGIANRQALGAEPTAGVGGAAQSAASQGRRDSSRRARGRSGRLCRQRKRRRRNRWSASRTRRPRGRGCACGPGDRTTMAGGPVPFLIANLSLLPASLALAPQGCSFCPRR